MRSHLHTLSFLALAAFTTNACLLLGPAYPVPSGLCSNSKFQEAVKSFDATLTASLQTGLSMNGAFEFNATTISIGMFSTSDKGLVHEYHYTDPSVKNGSYGTQKVDADSVYRLGSIGKLLTVYLFLIREGDRYFNDPITKYIPELVAASASTSSESSNGQTPLWSDITIGQLASHMGGLAKDCKQRRSYILVFNVEIR
jgi:hypothetical protein